MSIAEAAQILGVHPARVAHWIGSGRLEPVASADRSGQRHDLDRATVLALRNDLRRQPSAEPQPERRDLVESAIDPLSRARAVESYTAGLAATAIAPAVARLVETIDRLIAENGNLREENGRLKAEVAAAERLSIAPDATSATSEPPSAVGLSQAEWSSLGERIERLSRPVSEPPIDASGPPIPPAPARGPVSEERSTAERAGRRRKPIGPVRRFSAWVLRRVVGG